MRFWKIIALIAFVCVLGLFSVSGISAGIDINNTSSQLDTNYLDTTTNSTKVIDYLHHEIHEGDHFQIKGSSTLAATQILEFIVKTPDTTEWSHMLWEFESTAGAFTFVGYQDVTVATTGATSVTTINSNGNSSNTSSLGIWVSTGTGTTGTAIEPSTTYGVSGNPTVRTGGEGGRRHEKILKQNSWHVFRFTNGADAQNIIYDASWYEHTNN